MYSTFNNDPTLDTMWMPNTDIHNMTIDDIHKNSFMMKTPSKSYSHMTKIIKQQVDVDSDLGKIYFSKKNIARVQKNIKTQVYEKTKGKYRLDTDQDTKDLFIIMKNIYLTNAKYIPGQNIRQIKRLNQKVVDEVVPDIIGTISQYYKYLDDINKPIIPTMSLPQCSRGML